MRSPRRAATSAPGPATPGAGTVAAAQPRVVQVPAGGNNQRLDRTLAGLVAELSRARIQGLIRDGAVACAGRTILDPGHRVKSGDEITLLVPPPKPAQPEPQHMALVIAYEDEDLIVVDKPAGLVVHPAAGHDSGTLVNALIAHCGDQLSGIGGVKRPGIVHRLDKDTSGLLVVAKSNRAHQGLSEQFQSHGLDGRLERVYEALVWGIPALPRGTVDAALGRSPSQRTKIAVTRGESGRRAVTHYEVAERLGEVARLRLTLETGRTHQIRVHMAHIGHPVVGDATYGTGFKTRVHKLGEAARAAVEALGRQALHAAVLGFDHPVSGRHMRLESALPADMSRLIDELRIELRRRR